LRPPHISDVESYFKPFINKIKDSGIKKIVFISVQGAEKSSIIPHNKIENFLIQSNIEYIFVRPSYFIQNLSTTFLKEIEEKNSVTIPVKNGIFNWIDIENIGEASAQLILNFEQYKNKGYDLTGNENRTFSDACKILSDTLDKEIKLISPSIFKFFSMKRKEGMKTPYIIVMTMLHFLPRFQKAPLISNNFKNLTGKEPSTLKEVFNRDINTFKQNIK
jgi:uncharacterized protein YbjT (DUF2867 family)